jgi:hypothetical protein
MSARTRPMCLPGVCGRGTMTRRGQEACSLGREAEEALAEV